MYASRPADAPSGSLATSRGASRRRHHAQCHLLDNLRRVDLLRDSRGLGLFVRIFFHSLRHVRDVGSGVCASACPARAQELMPTGGEEQWACCPGDVQLTSSGRECQAQGDDTGRRRRAWCGHGGRAGDWLCGACTALGVTTSIATDATVRACAGTTAIASRTTTATRCATPRSPACTSIGRAADATRADGATACGGRSITRGCGTGLRWPQARIGVL